MLALVPLAALAASAPCDRPTTAADIDAAVHRARAAYATQDPVALAAASDEATHALACVVEPIGPDQAEAMHFVRGLWVATEQGEPATVPYLAAAHIGPDAALALALTERERETVDRLAEPLRQFQTAHGREAPPPLRGRLVFDGQGVERRPPTNAPYVLQRVAGAAVLDSRYVLPGDPPPRYRRLRPVLAGTALGLGVASAGLVVGGAATRSALFADHDPWLTTAEVDALQTTNHRLLIGAAATGGLGVIALGGWGLTYVW